jgi:hypothetical protein
MADPDERERARALIRAPGYQAATSPLRSCMTPMQPAIWMLLLASTIATFYAWIGPVT